MKEEMEKELEERDRKLNELLQREREVGLRLFLIPNESVTSLKGKVAVL